MDSPIDDSPQGYKPQRPLPDDLPRTLNDRRSIPVFAQEVEDYDPWQGQSHTITVPSLARPTSFSLALDDIDFTRQEPEALSPAIRDGRLAEMVAAQSRLSGENYGDDTEILSNDKLSQAEKREAIQAAFARAASNGEIATIKRILSGQAKMFIDLNLPDAEGTPPLIYASCFGHEQVVNALLDAGADVNGQDKNRWSALMWATTNKHKSIVKTLLDHGADPDARSSTGRTVLDFIPPDSDMSHYINGSAYGIGSAGISEDFYDAGLSQDRLEEEMLENEMKRRMMMESAMNLEVDLGNLGLDEQPETPEDELEEGQEFVWDRCLNDQMFVFQESELHPILDIIITHMTPQRSPSQKPVPANVLFLAARYAHYHANPELLENLLLTAMDKINDVVENHQWDMTILAFWTSNATLLLYYLKKDAGLVTATSEFQQHLAELINDIFILIIRDAERRMDKVMDAAILDHETIPGFEDVHFQNEWNIFRKAKAKVPDPIEKRFRPPSPKRRAQVSPRNITSLLSSTLFVLELYDIHTVIIAQVLAQLFYWLGAELFNRILDNRKYLARTKAMQIRMNVSTLEDWARANNRQPDHYEKGSMTSTGEDTVEAARRYLAPLVQMLQWLQCFSSFGEDHDALLDTIRQMPRLSPQQLLHAAKSYRPEVGEKGLTKSATKYLEGLRKDLDQRRREQKRVSMVPVPSPRIPSAEEPPATPTKNGNGEHADVSAAASPSTTVSPATTLAAPGPPAVDGMSFDESLLPEGLRQDPALMLPFTLPTATDMLVTYGAGFGGTNHERARKYIPTVPPEFLARLDLSLKPERKHDNYYEN